MRPSNRDVLDPLNSDSVLRITDRKPRALAPATGSPSKKHASDSPRKKAQRACSPVSFERVTFSEDDVNAAAALTADPLSDDVFMKSHKRGERVEKHDRNYDKEQAMFEKGLLDRLYARLRGPDWLKVLGITGVTDSDKKRFEQKREFFTRGVRSILQKFNSWKEQEKELKLREDAATAAAVAAAHVNRRSSRSDSDSRTTADGSSNLVELGTTPTTISLKRRHPEASPPEETYEPVESFFSKPYERAAAIGKHRRGRTVLAFGQPIPELPRRVFELPEEIMEEATAAGEL